MNILKCPACATMGVISDLLVDPEHDDAYLKCRACTEEIHIPTHAIVSALAETQKE